MNKKELIRSKIENLDWFHEKNWSDSQKEAFVDILASKCQSKYIDKAAKMIMNFDEELATNPIPAFFDKIGIDNIDK